MPTRPNVLVIIFDSLRADFVGTYGTQASVETPAMDSVADEGITFENAFAAGPESATSHASLFSGQYPSETGVVTDFPQPAIPQDIPLLPEWFNERGYRTFGIAGPGKMSSDFGFGRGFDRYVELYEEVPSKLSPAYLRHCLSDGAIRKELIRAARDGSDKNTNLRFDLFERQILRSDPPFFGLVNFPGVHFPYDPPRPFKEEATPVLSRPRWEILEMICRAVSLDCVNFENPNVRTDRVLNQWDSLYRYLGDEDWLNEAEISVWRDWYGAFVRYVDYRLGEFMSFLDERGLTEDTILLLLADHGEFLGEHGLIEHGDFLYDEVLHVPMILGGPGVPEGERRSDLVSLVDVFDTLCDLCDLPYPDVTSGQSAFDDARREAVFAECGVRDISDMDRAQYRSQAMIEEVNLGRKCIRTRGHKLIRRSDGSEQLFRLPDEERIDTPTEDNLAELRTRLADELSLDFSGPSSETVEVSDGVEQSLKDLGYR